MAMIAPAQSTPKEMNPSMVSIDPPSPDTAGSVKKTYAILSLSFRINDLTFFQDLHAWPATL